MQDETLISGTDAHSSTPSVSMFDSCNVCWRQINPSTGNGAIYNSRGKFTGGNYLCFSTPVNVSANDGYTDHYSPSEITCGDDLARICWVGTAYQGPIWGYVTKVVFGEPDITYRWTFGTNATASPSINQTDNGSGYALAWSENDGSYTTHYVTHTLSNPQPLSSHGYDVQLCNGPAMSSMKALTFKSTTAPYTFETSNGIGTPLQKVASAAGHIGREGNIGIREAEFHFGFADIEADNKQIDFVPVDVNKPLPGVSDLSALLESKPFSLGDNSSFTYSVEYGYTDSTKAIAAFAENEYLNFKLELADATTGEILGNFDNVRFDNTNAVQYKNISYSVNTTGIGRRNVKLRLIVTTNCPNPKLTLNQIYSENMILSKRAFQQISYKGNTAVKNYALSQNFPNPFNPSTMISYQLPAGGHVLLRVYDILGKEVMCLVNEDQGAGAHQVEFNASKLSSGIYLYKLECNGFTLVKKMSFTK
jgi:hypothetical protein